MDIKSTSEIIAFIMLLTAFSGLLYKIFRSVFTFIMKTWKRLEVAFTQLEYVHTEIKPNHGSSLYDKINKIQNEILSIKQEVVVQSYISRQIRDDMILIPYCEFAIDGNLKFSNKKFQELVGMTDHQLLDKGWFTLLPEEARITVFNRWQDSMSKKTPFQATFNLVEGNFVSPYILSTEQIKNNAGEVIYVVGKINKK